MYVAITLEEHRLLFCFVYFFFLFWTNESESTYQCFTKMETLHLTLSFCIKCNVFAVEKLCFSTFFSFRFNFIYSNSTYDDHLTITFLTNDVNVDKFCPNIAFKCYHFKLLTIIRCNDDDEMPTKIPVISIAAANMPAVCACFGATICGAYIIPNELIMWTQK